MILILVAVLSGKDEDFFISVFVVGPLYNDHRVDSLGKGKEQR